MSLFESGDGTLDLRSFTLLYWMKLGLLPAAISSAVVGGEFSGVGNVQISGSEGTATAAIVESQITEWDVARTLARIHGELTANATGADSELSELIDKNLFELYARH